MRPFLGGIYGERRHSADATIRRAADDAVVRVPAYEYQKLVHEQNVRAAERAHDEVYKREEKFQYETTLVALEAIKIALLINSGAMVAILAFVGAIVAKQDMRLAQVEPVIETGLWFLAGIVLASVSVGCSYFNSGLYSASQGAMERIWDHPYVVATAKSKRFERWGRRFLKAAIACAFG